MCFIAANINGNCVATCPASSVFDRQQRVYLGALYRRNIYGDSAITIGESGAQPGSSGAINTNILVVGNTFSNNFYQYFSCGGGYAGDPNTADDVIFSNNMVYGAGFVSLYVGGLTRKVTMTGNNCFGAKMGMSSGALGSPYTFVGTNNNYWTWLLENGGAGNPIPISYGGGSKYNLTYNGLTNVHTYLTVSDSNQIPVGAQMLVTNGTWNFQPVIIYTAGPNFSGPSVTIPSKTAMIFYWTGSAWIGIPVTNSPAVTFTETVSNGILPMTTQFQCPAADSTGSTITGWSWNFGDGSTSTLQNPSHVYTAAGVFSPSLTFTNSGRIAGTGSGAAIAVNQVTLGRAAAAGILTLSWPTNAAGYSLQYTTSLSPPVVWRPFLSAATVVNGKYVATNLMSGPQMFFRLANQISALITGPSQPKLSLILAGEKLVLTWPASAAGVHLAIHHQFVAPDYLEYGSINPCEPQRAKRRDQRDFGSADVFPFG